MISRLWGWWQHGFRRGERSSLGHGLRREGALERVLATASRPGASIRSIDWICPRNLRSTAVTTNARDHIPLDYILSLRSTNLAVCRL